MKNAIKKFWDSEDGMGVVEVVLLDWDWNVAEARCCQL